MLFNHYYKTEFDFNWEMIVFDEITHIWRTKLNLIQYLNEIKNEAIQHTKKCVIDKDIKTDAYGYFEEWKKNDGFIGQLEIKNKLDLICQRGIDYCIELYNSEKKEKYNKINTNAWINVVKSFNPVQHEFKEHKKKYHTHTDKSEMLEKFTPHYTYVYYIQMPDIMDNEDGVLYIKGLNDVEYFVKPEIDDLIILPAWVPHAPNTAPKSTLDRIVIAGNVGFENKKKEKSLI